jgi:hypothetical protein
MGGLAATDCMRKEAMGNIFGYEGQGIISDEQGLAEVGGVGVEIIQVAADLPPTDGQRQEDVAFCE